MSKMRQGVEERVRGVPTPLGKVLYGHDTSGKFANNSRRASTALWPS